MTQSSLLELAKSGNPQAIATLMNLVLEPKGVTAKASLQENCLHIFFTSEHLLSKATIASFVQSGLKSLGTHSFEKVRLYAQKVGQSAPTWIDEWLVNDGASPQNSSAKPGIAVPTPPVITTPPVNLSLPTLNTQLSEQTNSTIAPTPKPAAKRPIRKPTKRQAAFASSRQPYLKGKGLDLLMQRFSLSNRSKIALGVGGGAFLVGGVVAMMLNSHANSHTRLDGSGTTAAIAGSNNQILVRTNQQPATGSEAEAETYLTQMNKAQQAFYETNQRFASTLEELERSASIISHSSHYSYRLVVRDQSQSVLTATPKSGDLKSYAGTVLLAQHSTGSNTVTGIICKTNRASTFPPVLPQPTEGSVQCPADSAQVFY